MKASSIRVLYTMGCLGAPSKRGVVEWGRKSTVQWGCCQEQMPLADDIEIPLMG